MENKLLIQDLAEAISIKEGITKKKSEAFVKALFETIEEGLIADKFVKIKGLGTFKIISVGERESVNINTGERFSIEGHDKITFTPDTVLKDLVNRPFAHFQTVVIDEETDIDELESVENEPEEVQTQQVPEENSNSGDISEDSTISEDKEEENSSENTLEESIDKDTDTDTTDTDTKEESLTISEKDNDDTESKEISGVQEITATNPALKEFEKPICNDESLSIETKNQSDHHQAIDREESTTSTEIEGNTTEPNTVDDSMPEDKDTDTQEIKSDIHDSEHAPSFEPPAHNEDEKQILESENVRYIIKELEGKRNVWKTTALILLSILLLMLSYFAGYFRWFCPCELAQKYINDPSPTNTVLDQDDILNSDTVNSDSIIQTAYPPQEAKDSLVTTQTSNEGTHATLTTQPEQKVKPQNEPLKNTTPLYKQVEGGKYEITGTIGTHQIKSGETIRTIALDVYGSKGYALYIITHNNIIDPNNIECGTIIQLPKLKRKNIHQK